MVSLYLSVLPLFVAQRSAIQFLANQPPVGQISIHQRLETVIVVALQQMQEFVNNDVLQTLRRLLDQFQVEPDAPGVGVLATPSSESSSCLMPQSLATTYPRTGCHFGHAPATAESTVAQLLRDTRTARRGLSLTFARRFSGAAGRHNRISRNQRSLPCKTMRV